MRDAASRSALLPTCRPRRNLYTDLTQILRRSVGQAWPSHGPALRSASRAHPEAHPLTSPRLARALLSRAAAGYNEVIIASEKLNARLPDAIDAFFVLDQAHLRRDGSPRNIDVIEAHKAFLKRYALTEADVPLLKLTLDGWDAPFSPLSPVSALSDLV